ncbi:TPA: hypothetical protein EYP66_13265 [Candidatus Poribacteria bacterium]|nr:hypothetical protein [Candidatus Poribacteria bacterium]
MKDVVNRIIRLPELNIAFFAFLLNFSWEVLQTPFFIDISDSINTVIWYRFHCTLGDVLICLASYYLTALIFRNRRWFFEPTAKSILLFLAFGVTYTVFSEIKNVFIRKLWAYSPLMPVIPYLNVGLLPILQWIILPPIVIFITRRQLS